MKFTYSCLSSAEKKISIASLDHMMRKIGNGVWLLNVEPLNFELPRGICLMLPVNCCILFPELLAHSSSRPNVKIV